MAGDGFQSGVNFGLLKDISSMDPHTTEMSRVPLPDYRSEALLRGAQANQLNQEAAASQIESPARANLLNAQATEAQTNANLATQLNPIKLQQAQLANKMMTSMLQGGTGASGSTATMYPDGQGGMVPIISMGPKGPSVSYKPNPMLTAQQKNAMAEQQAAQQVQSLQDQINKAGGIQKAPIGLVQQYQQAQGYYTTLHQQNLKGTTPAIQNTNAMTQPQQAPTATQDTGKNITIDGQSYTPQQIALNNAQFKPQQYSMLTNDENKQLNQNMQSLKTLQDEQETLNSTGKMLQDYNGPLGPMTGEAYAKLSPQGQVINKNMNTLIVRAPTILGLPASALRIQSTWKLMQNIKPNTSNYKVAAQSLTESLTAANALEAHRVWQQNKDLYTKQASSPNLTVKQNALNWIQNNPDPVTKFSRINFDATNKLYPDMKDSDVEKNYNDLYKDYVHVENKDGQTGWIHNNELDAATKEGYKQIQ